RSGIYPLRCQAHRHVGNHSENRDDKERSQQCHVALLFCVDRLTLRRWRLKRMAARGCADEMWRLPHSAQSATDRASIGKHAAQRMAGVLVGSTRTVESKRAAIGRDLKRRAA